MSPLSAFGGAGGCAAIEAADAGSSVIIFELASASGGSTAMSSAEIYMGGSGGTRVQQACGFEDSTEDMVTYMMMAAGPQADEEKIRNYCENSRDHFQWLVDIGVPFKDSFHQERAIMCLTDDGLLYTGSEKAYPFAQQAKPCPRGHNLLVEGDNGGPLFMKIVTENVEQREAITVEYETRALTLIVDDEDRVVGLVIRQNQQELNVRAHQGVILCAGGFVMNDDMLRKYAPMLTAGTEPIGNPGDTGSGILMGMSVGGAAINMHEGFISLPYYPPASMTKGIVINDKGQRFINEDVYHGRLGAFAVRQQSERIYFHRHRGAVRRLRARQLPGRPGCRHRRNRRGAGAGTGPAPGHPATNPQRVQRGLRQRRRHHLPQSSRMAGTAGTAAGGAGYHARARRLRTLFHPGWPGHPAHRRGSRPQSPGDTRAVCRRPHRLRRGAQGRGLQQRHVRR